MQDNQIAADIDALKDRCADTRELYREVCALLFFRYGITPTANRLYQYVRKGSMSTPAQVLARFWDDLRERTRVRIDHPDLPDPLRAAAGELVLKLWEQARRAARQGLDAEAAEVAGRVEAERAATAAVRDEARRLGDALAAEVSRAEAAERSAAAERAAFAEATRELATIRGRLASMTEMLIEQGEEMRALRNELAVSQRDVARAVGEANALRVQLALAKRRRAGKPLGGVPQDPDPGQEDLGLERPAAPRPGGEGHGGDEFAGPSADAGRGQAGPARRGGPR